MITLDTSRATGDDTDNRQLARVGRCRAVSRRLAGRLGWIREPLGKSRQAPRRQSWGVSRQAARTGYPPTPDGGSPSSPVPVSPAPVRARECRQVPETYRLPVISGSGSRCFTG